MKDCTDYPNTNLTAFTNLRGYDKNLGKVDFNWQVQDRSAICAEKAHVVSPDHVDIVYGTTP